ILLFTAARRDHLERTIGPALARGAWVVSDRFADSTRVYQGATRGDLRALVDRIHDAAIGREPDITLVIDLAPEAAMARLAGRQGSEDRFERFGLPFQQDLRRGYAALARDFPERVRLIDGHGTEAEVADRVWVALAAATGDAPA
ncbi:MAG: thymidylate kinase, partial [Rhodobacteraceae bacterium]|nr:thymidylate kinase [Paracoccaceae bacterium]